MKASKKASRNNPTSLLSRAEEEQLTQQGWLLLKGVIAPGVLPAMHEAWERAEARGSYSGNNWGPRDLLQEEVFSACLEEPGVMAAVSLLLDGDVCLRAFHGRSPPRGHGRQGLHIDWSEPVPPERQILVNTFWMLDDVDEDNGATRIVPGSHRWRRAPRGFYAQPQAKHPEERVIRARAGDVLVFSSHVWHSGTENTSGRRRRVAIAQFSRHALSGPLGYE